MLITYAALAGEVQDMCMFLGVAHVQLHGEIPYAEVARLRASSPDLFLKQDETYRDSVLPPGVWARMALEAGVPVGWRRLVGPLGEIVAIENRFGASAPGGVVMEKYGFSAAQVAERARRLLETYPARAKQLSARLAGP